MHDEAYYFAQQYLMPADFMHKAYRLMKNMGFHREEIIYEISKAMEVEQAKVGERLNDLGLKD